VIDVREHLRPIERVDSADLRGDFVRLDRNDRASPMDEASFRRVLASLSPAVFGAYPDPQPLNRRFAAEVGLAAEQVCATNGSDAAIRRAFQAYVNPGDRVLFADPSYAMYEVYTRVFQGEPVKLAYDETRRLDQERLLALIAERPRLVCLANPDQPTGAALALPELRRVVEATAKAGTLCLIDEAYYPSHPVTAVPLVRDYDNLLVTRSFSKVLGLGGLRLGFACAQAPIVQGLDKVRGLHEVNAMAIGVALYLLDHPAIVETYLRDLEAGRQVLAELARRRGFGFPACPANFQLIELPAPLDPRAVVQGVKERGFLIKGGFKAPCLRRCLRVSLAAPDLMSRFVAALEAAVAAQAEPGRAERASSGSRLPSGPSRGAASGEGAG